ANRAAQLGLKTLVLEKQTTERYLCNSRFSSGVFSIAFHSIEASPEEQKIAILKETGGYGDRALIDSFTHNTNRAYRWLRDEGMKFVTNSYASVKGSTNLILAPPRRFREGLDWQGRGSDVLLRRLESNLEERGGTLLRGAEAQQLIIDEGRCVGLTYMLEGETHELRTNAVVIADGGFHANPEMVKQHIAPKPAELNLRAADSAVGDGFKMALKAGAAVTDLGGFYGHLQHRDALSNEQLWPYPSLDAVAVAGIMVGPDGKRLADEGKGGIYLANALAKSTAPLDGWTLFDEAIWQGPGKMPPVAVNPYLTSGGGSMEKADTISDLASIIGLPESTLSETVAEFNQAVTTATLDKLVPARTEKAGTAQAISTAPFYAVPLSAGITNVMGGISVDTNARALSSEGTPIAGLYACGAAAGGVEGGPDAGYIGGLAKAFVGGLLAGEHIADWHNPDQQS
ncbi:MAG: FAD-binding protein, partial [Rhodospirillaceae bacterium]|nr:FAD-binding protein [Rhodospirillaceae bacterium]